MDERKVRNIESIFLAVYTDVFVNPLANKSGFNESDLIELPSALIPEEQTDIIYSPCLFST